VSLAVRDLRGALRLLETKQVLTLTEQPGFVSLVRAITGAKVSGSWWGHPKGKLIYAITTKLEDHADVLACKLAGGKATFVHRTLWPALLRVVTDARWRKAKLDELTPRVVAVVKRAERLGSSQLEKTLSAREKALLEKSALLLVSSEHTKTGAHATVLRRWRSWARAQKSVSRAAEVLDFDAAADKLASAGIRL
jgi:hypothetical protein